MASAWSCFRPLPCDQAARFAQTCRRWNCSRQTYGRRSRLDASGALQRIFCWDANRWDITRCGKRWPIICARRGSELRSRADSDRVWSAGSARSNGAAVTESRRSSVHGESGISWSGDGVRGGGQKFLLFAWMMKAWNYRARDCGRRGWFTSRRDISFR